ncbi:MAG: hypothetical protein ACRES8_06625 [Nevskiaceae bacterium]
MNAIARIDTWNPTPARNADPQPSARHFLFSGRGPLRSAQIEALAQRRSWRGGTQRAAA